MSPRSQCSRGWRITITGRPLGFWSGVRSQRSSLQIASSSPCRQRQQSAGSSPSRAGSSPGGRSGRTRMSPSNGNVSQSATRRHRQPPLRVRCRECAGVELLGRLGHESQSRTAEPVGRIGRIRRDLDRRESPPCAAPCSSSSRAAAVLALSVGVIAATAGGGSTTASGQMHSAHAMTASTLTKSDLRNTLNKLLGEHAVLAMNATNLGVTRLEELPGRREGARQELRRALEGDRLDLRSEGGEDVPRRPFPVAGARRLLCRLYGRPREEGQGRPEQGRRQPQDVHRSAR